MVDEPRNSVPLWRNLHTEMTKAEVLEKCPGAIANPEPGHLNDGASSDLVLVDVEVGGNIFDANFYFIDGRLTQVTLTHSGQPTARNFEELVVLLRAKYGHELSLRSPDDDDLLAMGEADWLLPDGANVSLAYIGGIALNVNYQARLLRNIANL